jgi:hypothetical protein
MKRDELRSHLRNLAFWMRLCAEILQDEDNDTLTAHAVELRGAAEKMDTWIEGLEEEK